MLLPVLLPFLLLRLLLCGLQLLQPSLSYVFPTDDFQMTT